MQTWSDLNICEPVVNIGTSVRNAFSEAFPVTSIEQKQFPGFLLRVRWLVLLRKAFAELWWSFLCQVKEDSFGHGNGLSVLVMRLTRQTDERLVSRAPLSSNWFSPCAHLEWDYQTMLLRLPLFQQWHGSSCLRLLLKRIDGSDLGCLCCKPLGFTCSGVLVCLDGMFAWLNSQKWCSCAGEPQRSKPETNFALVCL